MTNDSFKQYFKSVPKTGVIYVLEKAVEMGYSPDSNEWANLGQGAPDTESLDQEKRQDALSVTAENSEYGPVAGRLDLRQKVADYYNHLFRKGSDSKYTAKNVCIAGGGRVALSRVVSALGNVHMGHFIPDYTAYEELLGIFKTFIPIPVLLDKANGYKISLDALSDEIVGRGLSAMLISNPCNPTGQVIKGEELNQWVETARRLKSLFIFDEFYSHYLYGDNTELVSAAEFVEDVNKDPLVIINGLSKNWRSPGWRIGWIVAPEDVIERVSSVGSFLDGGAVHPLQEEAVKMIRPESVVEEAAEIQAEFSKKRDITVRRLKKMGFVIDVDPEATFYVWCDISQLPAPLNQSEQFFLECLKEKVITVPGLFFDVNPGKRRLKEHSRYTSYVRISFGPTEETVIRGLDSIERVINKFR